MARFIKIPGVIFTDTELPKIEPYEDNISAIPEVKGWFRAGSESILIGPSGEMVWLNEIDNNLHCRQSNASMQPTLQTNSIGENSSLKWDGDKNCNLVWDGLTDVSASAKTTRVVVFKAEQAEGYTPSPFVFGSSVGGGNSKRNALYLRYSSKQLEYAVDTQTHVADFGVIQLGEWVFVICSYDESINQNSLSVNGSDRKVKTIPEPSSGLSNDLIIGSLTQEGISSWNGDIAEFMYIEKDLLAPENNEELVLIKNYLFAKYGIS